MMDSYWDAQTVFDIRTASFLYAGIYPPEDDDPRKPLPPKVANAKRLLEFERLADRLPPVHRDLRGPEEFRRADLQRLAERQDHHPSTLFPDQPPMTTRERREWARLVKVLCRAAEMDLGEPYKLAKLLRGMANDYKMTWPDDDKAMAKKLGLAGEVE